jgi:transposase
MNTTTVGLDIAKSYFQVHGVDEHGKATLHKQLRRAEVLRFFANMPACLIGIEACGSAHHWARKLGELGHQVKLMPAQFVKAYVKTNKNDARDAEAICEAVARPNMRFAAVKTIAQQELLMLHRVRQRLVMDRTAKANQLRGLLAEFGIVMPQGLHRLRDLMPEILADAENGLSCRLRERFSDLFSHLRELDVTVIEWERQIVAWHRENPLSRRLDKIPGIGPLGASALVASMGDVRTFKNGRQLAAWLGLVPRGSVNEATGICVRSSSWEHVRCCGKCNAIRLERRAGWVVLPRAPIPTSQRWLWRTRTPASPGRCSPTSASIKPITAAAWPSQWHKPPDTRPSKLPATDC